MGCRGDPSGDLMVALLPANAERKRGDHKGRCDVARTSRNDST